MLSSLYRLIAYFNLSLFANRQALFAYWSVFLGLGIAVYFQCETEPSLQIWACVLLVFAGLFCAFRRYIAQYAVLYFACHAVFAFLLGFTNSIVYTYRADTTFLKMPIKNQSFIATVDSAEQMKKGAHRYTLTVRQWAGNPINEHLIHLHTIRLKAKKDMKLEPGFRVSCTATLLPISSPVSPTSYNFKRDYYFKGIGAIGSLKECSVMGRAERPLANLRHTITEQLRKNIKYPYGDIAAALITGDRSGIPQDLRQQYIDAGLAHILAISGLHMGLVAGLIFFVIGLSIKILRLGLGFLDDLIVCIFGEKPNRRCKMPGQWISESAPIRESAAILTIFAMLFYLGISGYGYPAIRSFFMTSLVMMGIVFARDPLSMRSLALAASVILLLYPDSLLSASFQLSFSAVIALIAAYELFGKRLIDWSNDEPKIAILKSQLIRRFITYFLGITLTTLIATAATTPLSMAIFNRLTLQAVIGNLIALPLTAFWIMPLAVLSTLSLCWGGFSFCFTLFEIGLGLLFDTAAYVAALPGAGLLVPTPPDAFFGFFVLGGILLCLGPARAIRIVGLISVCGSMVFFHSSFSQAKLPIIYVAGDRSVMALYDPPYFRVSSHARGQFFVDQWRQQLAVPISHVVLFDAQDFDWGGYHIIVDPFKSTINHGLTEHSVKKTYLKRILRQNYANPILTNSFWKKPKISHYNRFLKYKEPLIHGELLLNQGSAFVYKKGIVLFWELYKSKRHWN